jgi:hypothetical protein
MLTTALLLALAAGCVSNPTPSAKEQAAYQAEAKLTFQPLDRGVAESVALVNVQERKSDDGRFEIAAVLRNRLNRRIEVQADCVFRDEKGFPTADEVPFQTVILTENAQEVVRFASLSPGARSYTIRVRQAR